MNRKQAPPRASFTYDHDGPLSDSQVQRAVDRFMKQVGARIAELREMRGFSQKQICEEHGFNQSQISRVEAGKMNLTLRIACAYAASLGVRPWELYVPKEMSALQLKPRKRSGPKPSKTQLDRAELEFRKQFGDRVRELRSMQGMSLMAMATLSGVEVSTL